MSDIVNILLNNEELNEEQLKSYLAGNLSAAESHDVEKQMAGSDFMNDAVEGLSAFSSTKKLDDYVVQLNKNLQEQTDQKKQRKEKREIKHLSWIILSVIIIIILCLVAFVIVRMHRSEEQHALQKQRSAMIGAVKK